MKRARNPVQLDLVAVNPPRDPVPARPAALYYAPVDPLSNLARAVPGALVKILRRVHRKDSEGESFFEQWANEHGEIIYVYYRVLKPRGTQPKAQAEILRFRLPQSRGDISKG